LKWIGNIASATSVLRYGGFSEFLETFVLNQNLGIFSNFGAKTPPFAKLQNHYAQCYE
jgi:hypothetical protein